MEIIPAVDILGGRVVRLEQGDYDRVKVYSDEPVSAAKEWQNQGARLLHVVDLDGARLGRPVNLNVVSDIVAKTDVEIELGGGLRGEKEIDDAFERGVHFAVIGTSAVLDEAFCKRLITRYGRKVIFAVDVKEKRLAIKGWEDLAGEGVTQYINKLEEFGAKRVIYTDISRDGMMSGPNLDRLRLVLRMTSLDMVVSGGISNVEDIRVLKNLEKEGLKGVIIGKALYEGKVNLEEAIRVS